MNEYLEKFEELREQDSFQGEQWFSGRQRLVDKYSWAVPNEAVLDRISDFDRIIEVGAGGGYWAHLLRRRGVDVEAYDIDPPDDTWTAVTKCSKTESSEYVSISRANAMLLVWPPYDEPMAKESLDSFKGQYLVYVGEGYGGCTGSDSFFEGLEDNWSLQETIDIPSYVCVEDNFYHYVRKY